MPVISGVRGFLIGVFNSTSPPPVYLSDKMVCALAVIVGELLKKKIHIYILLHKNCTYFMENRDKYEEENKNHP